jgi:hypothetical protein
MMASKTIYATKDEDGDALVITHRTHPMDGGEGFWFTIASPELDGGVSSTALDRKKAQDVLAALQEGQDYVGSEMEIRRYGSPEKPEIAVEVGSAAVILNDDQVHVLEAALRAALGTADLKVRGAKRQWWLFPFDALEEVLEADPVERVAALAADPHRVAGFTRCALDILTERVGSQEEALDLVCQVLEHGAAKYSPDNWRTAAEDLVAFRREYFSAMVRHMSADSQGEELDPESGLPHYAHVVCGGLFWTWHQTTGMVGSGAFSA